VHENEYLTAELMKTVVHKSVTNLSKNSLAGRLSFLSL